jgi:hypothetical protein
MRRTQCGDLAAFAAMALVTAVAGYGAALAIWAIFGWLCWWAAGLPWYFMFPVLYLAFIYCFIGGGVVWQGTTDAIREDWREMRKEPSARRSAAACSASVSQPSPVAEAIGLAMVWIVILCFACVSWLWAAMLLRHALTVSWGEMFLLLLMSLVLFWGGGKAVAFLFKPFWFGARRSDS